MRILPGMGFDQIAQLLTHDHLVRRPMLFKWYARLNGFDRRLQAGEYVLSTKMSPRQILAELASGNIRMHRLTIPEGYCLKQVAQVVADAGLADRGDFLDVAMDAAFVQSLGIDASSAEGYLFPETYFFPGEVSTRAIAQQMIEMFWHVFNPVRQKQARLIGMTVHQVVTLASIVEKETAQASERPLIASVFHNRLKNKMRLQSDPTVIYGIEDFQGNITRKHLRQATPYNTYVIKGLPPGPIACPGAAAIDAVLYPAQSQFLYFVSRKDGTHQFSRTLTEHNRAVRKFQLKKKT